MNIWQNIRKLQKLYKYKAKHYTNNTKKSYKTVLRISEYNRGVKKPGNLFYTHKNVAQWEMKYGR